MILDIQGSAGEITKSIPLQRAVTASDRVKLKYFHLPKLPLLDAFQDAVTTPGGASNIPPVSSIDALCNELDSITHGGNRILYCWYNKSEFEICTVAPVVTLSAAFAALLKMPTTLAANTCYSSSIFEDEVSLYSHYAVRVGHTRGFFSGATYNNVIAKVRRDGDVTHAHSHYFDSSTTHLDVSVFAVKRDGAMHKYIAPEIWSGFSD